MITRVVVADDHPLVRAGIIALLEDIPGVLVVGEACDGKEAVFQVAQLRPSMLLLDLNMPGLSGLDALALINEAHPDVRVVIISMHDSKEHVLRALKLGAVGFMLKDDAPEELAQAIKVVNQGNTWLSAAVSQATISSYLERSGNDERWNVLAANKISC
jgi:DNA-binding NarL/FixJ family response regulator